MERVEPSSLADISSLFRESKASASKNVELFDSVSDWGVSLVRRAHSPWLLPAPKALAGSGATRWCFAENVKQTSRGCGSCELPTPTPSGNPTET
jgi:hypothetical protein